jgi:cysteine desulfurase
VSYVRPDEKGRIRVRDIESCIRKNTRLISVMFANNEVGTIEPIDKIGELAKEYGIPFHTDAVQVVGHLPVDVNSWNITYLSASAHKFYGLKGCGILYCRQGYALEPLLYGGGQEGGYRAGTENVAAIVAMGAAADYCRNRLSWEGAVVKGLREKMIAGLSPIPGGHLMGDESLRLPGNVHFCFEGIDGKSLALLLQQEGICVSSGSACSREEGASHVLEAMGTPAEYRRGALRISLGPELSREDILYAAGRTAENVHKLRRLQKNS